MKVKISYSGNCRPVGRLSHYWLAAYPGGRRFNFSKVGPVGFELRFSHWKECSEI